MSLSWRAQEAEETWRIQNPKLVRELRREGFGGEEMTLLGCRWRRLRLSAVPDDYVVAEAKIDNGTRRFIDQAELRCFPDRELRPGASPSGRRQ